MLCLKWQQFLTTFLLTSSTFFSFCHGASQLDHLLTKHVQDGDDEDSFGVVSWGMRRAAAEESNANVVQNKTLILAAKVTHRRDPLAKFSYYNGGWNITDKHYLSSVGFTGIPLTATGAAWFLLFGIRLMILICCCCCCCKGKQHYYGYSPISYVISLIFLILFTMTTITGSGVLYAAQGKFRTSTTDILEYLLKTADNVVEKLRNLSENLSAAKLVGVDQSFLPTNVQNDIDNIRTATNISSLIPKLKTQSTTKQIQHVLDPVRTVLNIIAGLMLFLAFIGFVLSILGEQCVLYILMVVGWILVTATFILCGVTLVLHNAVSDTCVAMDDWVKNPTAQSALEALLPCMDNETAQATLATTREVTFEMVGNVNQYINNVANMNIPPAAGPLYYNQSGPLVPVLCNPFNSDKTTIRQCAAGEVELDSATQEWEKYVCELSPSGKCTTVGRLTPAFYDQMTTAVNMSYTMYHYGPYLINLVDCGFVRETFSDINEHYCPNLSRYSYAVYIGLLMVSAGVMLSLIFWLVYAKERRHRVYTKEFLAKSSSDERLQGARFL